MSRGRKWFLPRVLSHISGLVLVLTTRARGGTRKLEAFAARVVPFATHRVSFVALMGLSILLALGGLADARPGGGHSYSGGSSSSSGGGGGGGGGALVYLLIRLVFVYPQVGVPLVIIVIAFAVFSKKNNDGLSDWDSGGDSTLSLPSVDLNELRAVDENFSEVLFHDFVYELYARAHQARSLAGDMDRCAPYLAPAPQEALLARQPAGEPVRGVVIGSMGVISVNVPSSPQDEEGNSTYANVLVYFDANMTIGAPGSSKTHYVREQWAFARQTGTQSRPPDKARSLNCPNCDAPFESSDAATCGYCGEVVNNGRFEWLVTQITLLHEEARPPSLSGHAPEVGTGSPTVWQPQLEERLTALQGSDPSASNEVIGTRLALVFEEVTAAWGNLDLSRARPFVSDGLYNYLEYWITAYREQGLVNRNDNACITQWVITKVVVDKHFSSVTCRVWATGNDYTMEQSSGKVVGGSRSAFRDYSEYWTFIRGAKVTTSPLDYKQCPNCGAELKINLGGNCEFCAAHITSGEFDWVLSKIEQDEAV